MLLSDSYAANHCFVAYYTQTCLLSVLQMRIFFICLLMLISRKLLAITTLIKINLIANNQTPIICA
jgi:hypothetical protein